MKNGKENLNKLKLKIKHKINKYLKKKTKYIYKN